jgi:hypothetical protein
MGSSHFMTCTQLNKMDAQVLNQILQLLQPTYTIVPLQPNPPIVPRIDLSGLNNQPNPPAGPRLDMSALNQPSQREEVHTPPPLLHADQWHTAVSVQVEIDGDVRRIKWFGDLQLAYMSVNDFVRQHPDDNWTLRTFQQTVRIMKERWEAHRGDEGFVIAKTDGVKFRAFYEPEENESVRQQPSSNLSW